MREVLETHYHPQGQIRSAEMREVFYALRPIIQGWYPREQVRSAEMREVLETHYHSIIQGIPGNRSTIVSITQEAPGTREVFDRAPTTRVAPTEVHTLTSIHAAEALHKQLSPLVHAPPRKETARSHGQKPPVSHNSPADPTFRANSFPERLFTLETCCGYRYDQAGDSYRFPRIFKGRVERTRHHRNREKRTLARTPHDVCEFICVTARNSSCEPSFPWPGVGMLTHFPFGNRMDKLRKHSKVFIRSV
ncbi:hypothetical protein GPALN_014826 [Globodera pallida]|nr:hypothetical protein GPALN_014826 [Globodera pallida]